MRENSISWRANGNRSGYAVTVLVIGLTMMGDFERKYTNRANRDFR
ncbi:hypothetical protein GCM10022410_22240 [Amphibacillus indicireducens]|uniref:Uncharacterized protein n=1 Tax=Amphibacillus indicireducens TaxID=1076330 RepID=A0ABP7VY37_9BACI